MVLKSDQQPVKRGRGRPRKEDSSSKQVAQTKTTASRSMTMAGTEPKKRGPKPRIAVMADSSLTREEELAAFERRSNKSGVLTLLVLLLGIALIGYGMYLKLHQASTEEDAMDMPLQTTTNTGTTTGDVATETWSTDVTPTNNFVPWQESNLITDYFARINNGQTNTLSALEDTSFRQGSLRNYYNAERLATFVNNIIGGIKIENMQTVTDDPILQRNPNARAFDFMTVYTLKSDEKEYRDQWRAYTVQKGTGTLINGFIYSGANVAESPFFQFAKFGIK